MKDCAKCQGNGIVVEPEDVQPFVDLVGASEMARRLGVSAARVYQLRSGKTPISWKVFEQIMEAAAPEMR